MLTRDLQKGFVSRTKNAFEKYKKRSLKELLFVLRSQGGRHTIEVSGSPELISHGSGIFVIDEVELKTLLGEGVEEGGRLGPAHINSLDLMDRLAGPLVRDLYFQNFYSSILGAGYLTHNGPGFAFANDVNKGRDKTKGIVPSDPILNVVPAIASAPIDLLLKLRATEGEAFKVYRDALATIVNKSHGSPEKIEEAVADTIRPKINALDRAFKNSRKMVKASIRDDLIVGSATIGMSLFSGVLPANLSSLVAAIGGVHYTRRMLANISKLASDPPEVRRDKFYFLWKLNRKAERGM